jgi:ribosomal protein S18 acetylase RimI-like enzyme
MTPARDLDPASPRRASTLTERVWDLRWQDRLPWEFDGVRVDLGQAADVNDFLLQNRALLFGGVEGAGRFLADPTTPAKQRWVDEMDIFVLSQNANTIGILCGHPTDWTTYYLRSTALLPAVRGSGLIQRVMERMYEPLVQVGAERMEVEASPTNLPAVRTLLRQGFVVTSLFNSERWGACLRLTKHMTNASHTIFSQQFCLHHSGAPQRSAPTPADLRRTP